MPVGNSASGDGISRNRNQEWTTLQGMEDESTPDPLDELSARRREERKAVEEGGGGESEGFELSEQELIEHASHGDQHSPFRITRDAGPQEEPSGSVYGEADEEHHED
jgi:hypothetical protein